MARPLELGVLSVIQKASARGVTGVSPALKMIHVMDAVLLVAPVFNVGAAGASVAELPFQSMLSLPSSFASSPAKRVTPL